jgi:hypothetical protein
MRRYDRWICNDPPYLASGPKIFLDMLTAYRAGAKYVIVFNYPKYPETNPYGILSEEHIAARKDSGLTFTLIQRYVWKS